MAGQQFTAAAPDVERLVVALLNSDAVPAQTVKPGQTAPSRCLVVRADLLNRRPPLSRAAPCQ